MKKAFVVLLLAFSLVFALEQSVFNETVSSGTAGTDYSRTISLNNDVESDGKFQGLWGLALDVDSVATTNTVDDSLCFFPQYRIAGEWVTGDTITWNIVNSDQSFSSTTKWVLPTTNHNDLLVWWTDPTTEVNIQGYPFEHVRVVRVATGGTLEYAIDLRSNFH